MKLFYIEPLESLCTDLIGSLLVGMAIQKSKPYLSKFYQKHQIIDIRPGWTDQKQIIQPLKEVICIIPGQMVCHVQSKRLSTLERFATYDCASRVGGAIFAIGGEGDEQCVFQPGQFGHSS
jgi:hypothetical protein